MTQLTASNREETQARDVAPGLRRSLGLPLLVLYGIWLGTTVYFEAAMLIAMVGFVSTVAYCRYILRGDIIE